MITEVSKYHLEEYRCPCGKLLCKCALRDGVIEIKCKACREVVRFTQVGPGARVLGPQTL
mgnify:CR=1 FL=1